MGKYQVYKGDATKKQYYITNNFNGGINTVDVDEALHDSEFRDLVNIDLEKQGFLQSRRGFADIGIDAINPKHNKVDLDLNDVSLIKVLKNEDNCLERITDKMYSGEWLKWGAFGETVFNEYVGEIIELGSDEELNHSNITRDKKVRSVHLDYWRSHRNILAWDSSGLYLQNDIVWHNLSYYVSLFDNNSEEPGTGISWLPLNIPEVEDNKTFNDFEMWDIAKNYAVQEVVHYNNILWLAKSANQGNTPDTSSTYWLKVGTLQYYIPTLNAKTVDGLLYLLVIHENHIAVLTVANTLSYSLKKVKNLKELPPVPEYNKPLQGVPTVDYGGRIYISLNDISPYYKGILIFDRDTHTFTTWRGQWKDGNVWTNFDTDLDTFVYKPTPYDIAIATTGVTQGFNVLAETPLLYIDDQKTGFPSIRSVFLTNIAGGYIDKIPTTNDFYVNVIKTGNFVASALQLKFKNQNGDYLEYTLDPVDVPDKGGYMVYKVSNLDRTGADYILLDVVYQNKVITNVSSVYYVSPLYANGQIFAVEDEYFVYRKKPTVQGYNLADYDKIKVDYVLTVTDVNAQEPDDVEVFDVHMTEANDGKYFQFRSLDTHRTFIYDHSIENFIVITQTDSILHDTWEDFIPAVGKLVETSGGSSQYFYYYKKGIDNVRFVNKTDINLALEVTPLEGQYFEIGNDVTEPIKGLDLENAKLITIDNRLVYYNGNTIYFSALYQFDYVPNYNFVMLPLLSDDEIVTIKYYRGSWIVFTKSQIWRMIGTAGSADWELKMINDSIGCYAPNSVRSIENFLYFMSNKGLYRLTQNYYQEGLENVYKSDKNTPDLIPLDKNVESIMYRDQYICYLPKGYDYDVVRMYYNIELGNRLHPFVKDKLSIRPDNLFEINGALYSLYDSKFFVYDKGYEDFGEVYETKILTSNLNFGFPTHDKKIKNVYIKTFSDDPVLLFLTLWVDDYLRVEPYKYTISIDENEEIVYEPVLDSDKGAVIDLTLSKLDYGELGEFVLGDNRNAVHKVLVGSKGKVVKLEIKQKSKGTFGITNIGYLYKLGKVKEQR